MNRRELAVLICKSLSLLIFAYSAILAVVGLLTILSMLLMSPLREWTDWTEIYIGLVVLVPSLAPAIVATVYWKKSDMIASLMTSDNSDPVATVPITVQDVMLVTFSTVGIFILCSGVKEFVSMMFIIHEFGGLDDRIWESPRVWNAIVELGFGLWLLLGSHGIVQVIRWLRTAGNYQTDEDSQTNHEAVSE